MGLELEGVVVLGRGCGGIGGFEDDEAASPVAEGKEFSRVVEFEHGDVVFLDALLAPALVAK